MSETEREETEKERLLRHIKTTYQARYSANRRLLHVAKLQNITSIINSVLVTIASALLLAPFIQDDIMRSKLNCILLALSIISLAMSIALGGKNNQLLAAEFHRCGRELQTLHDGLLAKKEINVEEGYGEYNRILNNYNINHDKADCESVKNEDRTFWQQIPHKIKSFISTDLLYYFLIIAPIASAILLIILSKDTPKP